MLPLRDLQRDMRAHVLGLDGGSEALPAIRADGLDPERRLRVYRNNTFLSLTAALQATYPVVCRLVDERFFGFAAASYIRKRPPTSPCLFEYGADFADFLAGFEPARRLDYLPDVARLEWAINDAFFAPDVPPLDPARLAAVAPARYADLALRPHPSCRLLASRFPIERIWQANQPGEDAGVDLGAGASHLVVHRQGNDVRMDEVGKAGLALLLRLAEGGRLHDAYLAAAEIDAGFDLSASLHRHLARGVFTGFALPYSPEGGPRERDDNAA